MSGTTQRSELLLLAQLAWPVALGQLGMMAMGLVDLLIAGYLGSDALAAVGLGHAWSFAFLVFGMGVAMGIDPAVTHAFGAGDPHKAGLAAARGAVLMLALTVPIVGAHLVALPGLALLGQPPEILETAATYSQVQAFGVLAFLLFSVLKQFLQGRGQMRTAMWVIGIGNLANLVLDWVCVRMLDLGVPGLAWSSVGVRWVMLGSLALLGARSLRECWPTEPIFDLSALLHLARTAVPVGFQVGLEVWAFNATTFLAGTLGAAAAAAHVIAISAISLAFMIPLGVSAAVATRVGNLVGAGKDWRHSAWIGVGLGTASMLVSGLLFYTAPEHIAQAFQAEPEVAVLVAVALPVGAAFGLSDGVQVVLFGVLRGLGDTRVPVLFPLFAYWGVGLPLAAVSVWAGYGLWGIWAALSVALTLIAVMLAVRVVALARRSR